MKRYRVLTVLAAAMLLTACGSNQDSENPAPAETVQTTGTGTGSTPAAQTGTDAETTTVTAAETTENSAASAVSETTGSEGTSASSAAAAASSASSAAGSTAAVQTTTASTGQKVTQALIPLQEAPLPEGTSEMLTALMDGLMKSDRDAILKNSNLSEGAEIWALFNNRENNEEALNEIFSELEADYASYKLVFTANRPDLLWWYQQSMAVLFPDETEELTDAQKQTMRNAMEHIGGVTEICSAEFELHYQDGTSEFIALPLVKKNGSWKVDLYLYGFMEMPMTREHIKANDQGAVSQLFSIIGQAYEDAVKELGTTPAGEQEITWKSADFATIAEMKDKTAKTDIEYLKKMLSARNIQYEMFQEIRFLLKDGKCCALAAIMYDGYIWSYPLIRTDLEYTSLEQAFSTAKDAADDPSLEKID